jgi:uncharacterized membrane protein (UPF0127 family)
MTRGRTLIILSVIGVLAVMGWYRTSTYQPQPPLPTVPIVIKGREQLQVEIAAQPVQRERGLMFRSALPADGGMLFVFPEATELAFWMKHTSLPLSIAFVGGDGRIVNIEDMQPFDTTLHRSAGPARAALEVSQGWFAERGIAPGDTVQFDLPSDLDVR